MKSKTAQFVPLNYDPILLHVLTAAALAWALIYGYAEDDNYHRTTTKVVGLVNGTDTPVLRVPPYATPDNTEDGVVYGVLGTLAFVTLLAFYVTDRRKHVAGCIYAFLLQLAMVGILKKLVGEWRPNNKEVGSFPSEHTSSAAVITHYPLMVVLLHLTRSKWQPRTQWLHAAVPLFICYAMAVPWWIGATRIFGNHHWPWDVVGGYLIGVEAAAAVALLLVNGNSYATLDKEISDSTIAEDSATLIKSGKSSQLRL